MTGFVSGRIWHTKACFIASIQAMDQAIKDYCTNVLGIKQLVTPQGIPQANLKLHFPMIDGDPSLAVNPEEDTQMQSHPEAKSTNSVDQSIEPNSSGEPVGDSSTIHLVGPSKRLVFVIQNSSADQFLQSKEHQLLSKMIVAMKEQESQVGICVCRGSFKDSMELPSQGELRVVFGLELNQEIPAHQFVKKGQSKWLFTHGLKDLMENSSLKKQTWSDLQMVMKELES